MGIEITPAWIDAIVGGMAAESAGLCLWLHRRGADRWIAPLALMLAAGAALLLGLRASLAGASSLWIGLALLVGLAAHLASLSFSARVVLRERPGLRPRFSTPTDPRSADARG